LFSEPLEPGSEWYVLCRRTWGLDKNTVLLLFDPSSPNIINPVYIGDAAYAKLRRPFWQELQSRYGNMFYVRDEVGRSYFTDTNAVSRGKAAYAETVADTIRLGQCYLYTC
jgi:hypothetical protein